MTLNEDNVVGLEQSCNLIAFTEGGGPMMNVEMKSSGA